MNGLLVAGICYAHAPEGYTKRLPDGAVVRVEAVGAGNRNRSWRPDGGQVGAGGRFGRYLKLAAGLADPKADPHLRWVLLSVEGSPLDPSVAARFAQGPARDPQVVWRSGKAWLGVVEGNHREAEVPLTVGVADGPWKTIGWVERQSDGKVTRQGKGFLRTVRPWQISSASKGQFDGIDANAALPTDAANRAYRVIAKDRQGKELPIALVSRTTKPTADATDFIFRGKYADVLRVELQTRRYDWVTVPHVRLNPKP